MGLIKSIQFLQHQQTVEDDDEIVVVMGGVEEDVIMQEGVVNDEVARSIASPPSDFFENMPAIIEVVAKMAENVHRCSPVKADQEGIEVIWDDFWARERVRSPNVVDRRNRLTRCHVD